MRQWSDDRYGRLLLIPEIRFAYAAVSRLLEPAPPVVMVHGPAGTGKSHLVRHAVRQFEAHSSELRMSHVTAAEFTAELAKASKAKTIPEFQEARRRLDLFVCEDLQTLEGRGESQQQLLAILDAIAAEGGRVLLTARKSPGDLENFLPKLRNRCLGGVCAATSLPGAASRKRLLTHFAEEQGIPVPEAALRTLATSLAVSVRELQGIVVQLKLLASKRRQPVDEELVRRVIADAIPAPYLTLPQITRSIARCFDVSPRALKSPGRLQGLVVPRQLAMFAAREWAHQPYSEIGKYFGRRSHSTIVHACQRIREKIAADTEFRSLVEGLQDQLRIPPVSRPSTTC